MDPPSDVEHPLLLQLLWEQDRGQVEKAVLKGFLSGSLLPGGSKAYNAQGSHLFLMSYIYSVSDALSPCDPQALVSTVHTYTSNLQIHTDCPRKYIV